MSFAESHPARQRSKRRRLLIALAFAVLAALLAGVARWALSPALSDAERALVGTWAYQWEGELTPLSLVYEFHPDGRCAIRYLDHGTGTFTDGVRRLTWKLRGDKLVVRHPKEAPRRFWGVFGLYQYVDEVQTLTPDGPDRFRYTGTIRGRYTPSHNALTGVMTRVVPPP